MMRHILSLDRFGITLGILSLSVFTPTLGGNSVLAAETGLEKSEAEARVARAQAKKNWRKTKKHVRDATGNGSAKEDAKDTVRNTGDAIDDTAKSVKDKVD